MPKDGIKQEHLQAGHFIFVCQHPTYGHCYLDVEGLDFSLDGAGTGDDIRKVSRATLLTFVDHMEAVSTVRLREFTSGEGVYEVIQFEPMFVAFWPMMTAAAEAAGAAFRSVGEHPFAAELQYRAE
jgi:hypothetical protein